MQSRNCPFLSKSVPKSIDYNRLRNGYVSIAKNPGPALAFKCSIVPLFHEMMIIMYLHIYGMVVLWNGLLWNIGKWNIWESNILEYLGEEYEGRYIWHLTSTVRYSDTAGFCDKSNTIFWHHCQHNSTFPIIQYPHSLIRATLA